MLNHNFYQSENFSNCMALVVLANIFSINILIFSIINLRTTLSINYVDHVSCDVNSNFELKSITEDAIYSIDNNTRIVMQNDGNLVLSSRSDSLSDWRIKWQTLTYSNTINNNRPSFSIQRDRNLVVYGPKNCVRYIDCNTWQADNACIGCDLQTYHFIVHNDGYAYLLDSNLNYAGFTTNSSFTSYPASLLTSYPTSTPTNPSLFPTSSPTITPTISPSQRPTDSALIAEQTSSKHVSTTNISEFMDINPEIANENEAENNYHGLDDNFILLMVVCLAGLICLFGIICMVCVVNRRQNLNIQQSSEFKPEKNLELKRHGGSTPVGGMEVPNVANLMINTFSCSSEENGGNEHVDNDPKENGGDTDVDDWIKNTVGFRDCGYENSFMVNGYDSLDIIKEITTKDELKEIGITLKGHQTKIMAEIRRLRLNCDVEMVDFIDIGQGKKIMVVTDETLGRGYRE